MQKLSLGFKNHMRSLDNFRQPVESPKSWNSMGYICPKNTFLQLKQIQRIYLTLLSTTCVKIHQIPYFIFETITYFSRQNSNVLFSSNIAYFWQKYPIKVKIFRFSTARVNIHQISHAIFKTKNESLDHSSLSWEISLQHFFSWNFICYWQK